MTLQSRLDYWREERIALDRCLREAGPELKPMFRDELRVIGKFITYYEAQLADQQGTLH